MPQIIKLPPYKVNTEAINIKCPHCHCTLAYTEDEVERVDNESMGVYCPYCSGAVETKHIKPFTFPDTFCHFDNTANNKQIQEAIDKVKRDFVIFPEDNFNYILQGDVAVFGYVEEEGNKVYHHIVVAKEYWEEEIQVEEVGQEH